MASGSRARRSSRSAGEDSSRSGWRACARTDRAPRTPGPRGARERLGVASAHEDCVADDDEPDVPVEQRFAAFAQNLLSTMDDDWLPYLRNAFSSFNMDMRLLTLAKPTSSPDLLRRPSSATAMPMSAFPARSCSPGRRSYSRRSSSRSSSQTAVTARRRPTRFANGWRASSPPSGSRRASLQPRAEPTEGSVTQFCWNRSWRAA